MTKTSKISLAVSIIAFALGFTDAGSNFGWGILKPISAVAFMVFFLTNLMAKEVAIYDAEERVKRKELDRGENKSDSVRNSKPSGPSQLRPA